MTPIQRVLSRMRGITLRAIRKMATWPLRLLPRNIRADVLQEMSDSTIITTEIPGGRIKFLTPGSILINRARSVLTKETDTIRWIDGFKEGDVFWDIGANIGVYSLYAAIRKQLSVLAFEPFAANYYVLTRNIQLNQTANRITAYCLAISGQTQIGVLNVPSSLMGSALNQFGALGEHSPFWEGPSEAVVHGMVGFAIDDFLAQFHPLFPTHVKIDVDGLELSILEGAKATLKDPRLRSLLIEVNLKDSKEKSHAFQILDDADFCLSGQGEIQGSHTEKSANHLFEKTVSADRAVKTLSGGYPCPE